MLKNVLTKLLRKLEKYKRPVQKDWEGKMQIEAFRSAKMNLIHEKKKIKIHREIVK